MSEWIRVKFNYLKKLKNWHGLVSLVVFLIVTIPSGTFLLTNVPAMWAPDGGAHVARVFQIAEGGLRSQYINHNHGVGYGGAIPENVNDLKNLELNIIGQSPAGPGQETTSKILTAQDKQAIDQISNQKISKTRILISFVNTAAYSPVAYAPNVVGVFVGIHLNLTLGHTLLLSRMCSFFTFLICISYALFTLRRSAFKWLIMTVSLLPLVVFQQTVITADSFLYTVAILFSALVLKALSSNLKLNTLDKIILFLCILLIPLLKSVYFPLVFVILLLPKRHWKTSRRYWIWAASSLILSMIGFAIWAHLTTDVAASNGLVRGDTLWKYGDAKVQEKYILHHPFDYIKVLINCVVEGSQFYMQTFFGWLGFTYLPIPGIASVAGYLSLGMSMLLVGKAKFKKHVPTAILGIVAVTTLIIFTTLYVYYSLPQNKIVEGVQGRYFIPLVVLLIAGLAASMPKLRIAPNGITTAKVVLTVLITFCLTLSVYRYGLAIN